MSRVFGRQYDLNSVCSYVTDVEYEKYKPNMRKSNWDSVYNSGEKLDLYLSPKVISLLEKEHVMIARNILKRKTDTFVFNDKDTYSTIVFPTYGAKEDYKIQYAKFIGEAIAGNSKYTNEFEKIVPLMFEYFYLDLYSQNPDKEFELRNLHSSIKPAKIFKNNFYLYNKYSDYMDLANYESDILKGLHTFSSFEGALQLIELFKKDPEKVKGILEDIILRKGNTYDILADNDIYSYGYKSLRKTVDRRKVK